ncbi:MAG: hypothetical protein HY000_15220 [Planctomycetes bacterium]|nr:hypothetical protein [Planctomycetota bacterium]
MSVLTQFIFRLGFGLALAMACTSPRLVVSGFFRVHLWVLLGLNVLAVMVAWTSPERFSLWPPMIAATLSYLGSVAWLYEKPRSGRVLLWLVAGVCLVGAWSAAEWPTGESGVGRSSSSPAVVRAGAQLLHWLDPLTGGLVLGGTFAAMLLGHWYLNEPSMELSPIKRLVLLMGVAILLRSVVCGLGLAGEWLSFGVPETSHVLFVALRWLSGLVGTMVVAVMAWETLKIPNTQSATGILYVGVITTFLGELTAQLLSAEAHYPL